MQMVPLKTIDLEQCYMQWSDKGGHNVPRGIHSVCTQTNDNKGGGCQVMSAMIKNIVKILND